MTPPRELDDVGKALARIDRNQWITRLASLAGYLVWVVATFRFIHMAEQSDLSVEVSALLRMGALLLLFGGMATQFMVCNYINEMATRILRAIHVAQTSETGTSTKVSE